MSYLDCFMFRRKWEVGAFVSRLRRKTRKRSKKRNATEPRQAKYIWTEGDPAFLGDGGQMERQIMKLFFISSGNPKQ